MNEDIMNSKIVENHKKLMLIEAVLGYQMFLGPILVIFYLRYIGISFSQYCALDAILFLLVALFEIPSGYIADVIGRKKMLIISNLVVSLSMAMLVLYPTFLGASISVVLQGIFIPLGSGNADAIYYESFSRHNSEKEFENMIGKCRSVSMVVTIIASIATGFMAEVNLAAPIIVDAVLLLISSFAVLLLLNDKSETKEEKLFTKVNFSNIEWDGILNVTPFFIIGAVLFSVFRTSYSFYQPLFSEANIDIAYFGVIFAVLNLLGAITSYYSSNIIKNIGNETKMLMMFFLLTVVSFSGISIQLGYIFLLFIGLQQIIRGLFFPYFGMRKNLYIPSHTNKRVTYLSYSNLLSTIIVSLSLGIMSFLGDYYSLIKCVRIIGVLHILFISLGIYVHLRLKKKGVIICYQTQ